MAEIRYGEKKDLTYLLKNDDHIDKKEILQQRLNNKQVIVAEKDSKIAGWLRFSYLWEHIPFMNLIWLHKKYRGQGIGTKMVSFWEKEMKAEGFDLLMTSSLSDKKGQFFHRKNGYKDAGCFILEEEALEIIFKKKL
ncbi:MAG: GNAT family N-acetyltransferase [Halanaerobiaceae bacterium]